jgi:hypothetical protein
LHCIGNPIGRNEVFKTEIDYPAFMKDGKIYHVGDCVSIGATSSRRRWDMPIDRIFKNASGQLKCESRPYHRNGNAEILPYKPEGSFKEGELVESEHVLQSQ